MKLYSIKELLKLNLSKIPTEKLEALKKTFVLKPPKGKKKSAPQKVLDRLTAEISKRTSKK